LHHFLLLLLLLLLPSNAESQCVSPVVDRPVRVSAISRC